MGEFFATILPPFFQFVLPGSLVALIGGWFMLAGKRREKATTDAAAEAAADAARTAKQFPGWHEVVEENRKLREDMDEIRKDVDTMRRTDARKMSAVARILRALYDQWPAPHMPNLDPGDIAEIEDTVPPAWKRRRAS